MQVDIDDDSYTDISSMQAIRSNMNVIHREMYELNDMELLLENSP